MAYCPICGKETTDPKTIKINDKKLDNLCSECQNYLICLTKPVSQFSRTNAQIWATEILSKNPHPYIGDIITACYNYSFSDNVRPTDATATRADTNEEEEYVPDGTSVHTGNTTIVKSIVYFSYILFMIAGGAVGYLVYDVTGLFVGAFAGIVSAIISGSILMMFAEISSNIAANAKATLRNEKLLEEIRDYLKNSQK